MKYIKKFENIGKSKYKVGDYVEVTDETIAEFNFDKYAEITEIQFFQPNDEFVTQYELTDLNGELLYLFDENIIRRLTDEEFELYKNSKKYGI